MPIDTSMYNTKAPESLNPLTTLGTVANTANALQQNKLIQANIQNALAENPLIQARTANALNENKLTQGRMEVERILSDHANDDGTIDFNGAMKEASSNPLAAPIISHLMDIQNKQQEGVPVMTPTPGGGWQQSIAPRQSVNAQLNPGAHPKLPQQQVDDIHDHLDTMQDAIGGLLKKQDLGLDDVLETSADLVGEFGASGGKRGISPQEAITQFSNIPQGVNGREPSSDQLKQWLQGHYNDFTAKRAQLTSLYGPSSKESTPMGASAQPQGKLPTLATGVPVGEGEALTTASQGAATALNGLHASVAGSGGRIFQLRQALEGLENAPTGKGTETTNAIKSFLLAQTPDVLKNVGLSPDEVKVAEYDKAKKYLTQYAMGQLSGMGQGTNEKLATALSGNASTDISNLAAKQVVKAAIGLEKMQQAQAQAFDQSGLPPQQYNKFQTQWNKDVDPRVFMMDVLDSKERAAMISSLKGDDKSKFIKQYRAAIKSGFLSMPKGQGENQ